MTHVCKCGVGHTTFGACIRAKSLNVGWARSSFGLDYTAEKLKDRELSEYKSARDQGVQPGGTQLHQTRMAMDMSEKTGKAFNAEHPSASIGE